MAGRLTNQLLKRAGKIAAKASAVQAELTSAFNERYGTTYSDVDADAIIDVLDYGGGAPLTVSACDDIMSGCGAPPLHRARTTLDGGSHDRKVQQGDA